MSYDRHEKWVPVEPGTVIPAGQPYRLEYCVAGGSLAGEKAYEYLSGEPDQWVLDGLYDGREFAMFVDSSWKPPLDLPTEPTWGIAVDFAVGKFVGRWRREQDKFIATGWILNVSNIVDFIPLTIEQAARIEGAA